jgi:hypothetical protein
MKLYEIVVRTEFDDMFCKTILVMSDIPLAKDSECVAAIAKLDKEWGEYIYEVSEKRVLVCASNDESASDMFGVLSMFGQ